MPDPGILVYRTDWDYYTAHPEIEFPAFVATACAAAARIAQEVPALAIAYAPPPAVAGGFLAVSIGKGGIHVDRSPQAVQQGRQ